jgi:Ser/Thr protein kinase RdoA (MazF antagonist)
MELTKDFIEQNWSLTEVEVGKILNNSGGARIVGLLESQQGKYIYKIADEWKTEKSLARDLSSFDFLNDYGFKHISSLLKTKTGKTFIKNEGKFVYLMEYVEGHNPEPTPTTFAELGKITALLHKVENFPFQTDFDADVVVEELKKNSGDYAFGEEYLRIVNSLSTFKNLPKTPIHTDISPGNSIQKKDGTIILLDWDDVGVGVSVLDVGQPMINHFISEDLEFFKESARSFYKAYFNERKLTDEEMKVIFDAGLFYALMYIIYGDMEKRWRRIKWAIKNRETLESLIRECAN